MSRVFFPTRYIDVPASFPHEGNPGYRVSYGIEHWGNGSAQPVFKVQMTYDGMVAGRKSPSYPEGTDDMERVLEAMRQIRAGKGLSGRGQMTAVGEEPGYSLRDAKDLMAVE